SETLAKRISMAGIKQIESPVDGIIKKIDTVLGVMIIREILERPDVPIIIDLTEKFKDPKRDFRKYVLRKEGDRVEYGQTIAGIKIMPKIPMYTKKVVAPCAGTIIEIDYENGKISIQKDFPTTELKAHYWGRVSKVIPQYGAELEFSGYVLEGTFGTGDFAWGKLVRSDTDVKDNIIFVEYPSNNHIESIIRLKPAGIIIGSIDYKGIEFLKKNHITSVIVEGFGKLDVPEDHKNFFAQSTGRNIVLKASTQVRAGVVRPKIIIPSDEEYFECKTPTEKVKVIWGQYYGKTGVIKKQPHFGKTISGIETWLCDVECDDGTVITLPINNQQMMQ
ncbi:MAG: hypothetical protein JSW02_07780, partial [candidate division WOR-3 bacterium]